MRALNRQPNRIGSDRLESALYLVTHLRLGQHQAGGHLEAFRPRQVLASAELVLQLEQLLRGERGARPARLVKHVRAYRRLAGRWSLVRVVRGKWATRVKIYNN